MYGGDMVLSQSDKAIPDSHHSYLSEPLLPPHVLSFRLHSLLFEGFLGGVFVLNSNFFFSEDFSEKAPPKTEAEPYPHRKTHAHETGENSSPVIPHPNLQRFVVRLKSTSKAQPRALHFPQFMLYMKGSWQFMPAEHSIRNLNMKTNTTALLFNLHGNGSIWEIDSIGTQDEIEAIVLNMIRNKRAAARQFMTADMHPDFTIGRRFSNIAISRMKVNARAVI